jgi:AcrR family transcriptional regulator
MTARAEATKATGEAILDAALAAFERLPFEQVTLKDVAERSGVTVQTVLRRYGSKELLFEAVAERERVRVVTSRAVPEDADLKTALAALLDHYEQDGDVVLHLVAQEHHSSLVREVVHDGRRIHREWVERHCEPVLAGTRGHERERRILAAIAATDLSTWHLLRRDLGLERGEVEAIMSTLLNGMEKS